jgi:DNA invertase Pin-like site-specific DNA recombinase
MKATIYARVSSTSDRQDTTRQVEDLTAYAQRNGLALDRTFTEKVSGAKSRKDRPVLDQCLKYCVANHIDILLVSELSRLGRNVDDILQNVIFCKTAHLNIYFQKEGLSLFQPDGSENPYLTVIIAVLGTCASIERENIKFRLNSGREKYIRDGGKLGRKEGYRKQPDDYERDYPEVFKELRRRDRLSYDRIARLCKVSKNTVITCARLLTPANQKPE